VPGDPSFYVNVATRTDPSLAPEGCDTVYVLVPVPHQAEGVDWSVEGPKLRAHIFDRLEAIGCGDLREQIEVEHTIDPNGWADSLNLERGAAFGLSHNFFQVGYFRPSNQDATFKNLFFVGASTQPGTGLPMVLLSARLVTERILGKVVAEAAA
ncbi:MAG: phytoene desaturase, partial [Deltaproteobacteria bacterium]